MASELSGKKIAFLMAQEGVEEVELTHPWEAVEQARSTFFRRPSEKASRWA